MIKYKHLFKTIKIQMLLLLITTSLFKSSVCFHTGKKMQYYSKSSNFFDNDLKSASYDNTRTKRDITFPVIAPDQNNFMVSDIASLLKLLKVPGYNVHRLDINDEKLNAKYESYIRKLPPFNLQSKSMNLNETKLTPERRFSTDNDLTNHKNNTKTNSRNTGNGCEIDNKCNDQDVNEAKEIIEETTTDTSEVTTTIGDGSNQNSTILSEYDDEEYGSLSNRADISPSLLASLVG